MARPSTSPSMLLTLHLRCADYINNELVRQDLRETQSGIDLVLDIGVIDINTCEPLENVYVEM